MCVCSLKYPAGNAHAPYCHPWPVRLYKIFPHYLINGTILENVSGHRIWVLIFSTTFMWKNFILRRNEWDMMKNLYCCSCKVPVILVWLKRNLNFQGRFSKILKYQVAWKSVQWKSSFSMRTDRHEENCHFSQFCERAWWITLYEIHAWILISSCNYYRRSPNTRVGSRMSGLHEYDTRGKSQWQTIVVR